MLNFKKLNLRSIYFWKLLRHHFLYSLFFFLCIFFTTNICFADRTVQPFGEITKDQIKEKHFINWELDDIEGLWIATLGNQEYVIIKNTLNIYKDFDYIGITASYGKLG